MKAAMIGAVGTTPRVIAHPQPPATACSSRPRD